MIETAQTITINAGIASAWDYAHDINKWANLMPGLQSCDILDADNSRWVLKVGAGGLVRTVKVDVHITEWAGPEKALFTFKLDSDPVEGGGSYNATPKGPNEIEVTLRLRVQGSGPMAPMWEAMGKPLLPTFAKAFAQQLKVRIEEAGGALPPHAIASPSIFQGMWHNLGRFWRGLFGSTAS